jgi:hypothetical protein
MARSCDDAGVPDDLQQDRRPFCVRPTTAIFPPYSAGQAQWVGVEEGNSGLLTTLYAYYNGTAWSNVDGATATPHSPASTTVTAHIPGTDATWAVGGLIASTTGSLTPGRALIEYNR